LGKEMDGGLVFPKHIKKPIRQLGYDESKKRENTNEQEKKDGKMYDFGKFQ
jgi:hypothetical protein